MSETIQLDLSQETIDTLLQRRVEVTLSPPSVEMFHDKIAEGASVFEAAGYAEFNECVLRILDEVLNSIGEDDNE